jgi:F-type H+-transporting ATPase subunit delta
MSSAIARRYAGAYFEVALDQQRLDQAGADLERARTVLDDPRVRGVLDNPRNSAAQRADLAMALLAELGDPARNLVRLLLSRGRIKLFGAVVEEHRAIVEGASGEIRAVVTSAVALDDATEAEIARTLSERWGRPVRVVAAQDPELIGGLVIRIGDRVIDDSVRSHLQQLQAALA